MTYLPSYVGACTAADEAVEMLADPAAVQTWARTLPPDQVISQGDPSACLLATYLRAQFGKRSTPVYYGCTRVWVEYAAATHQTNQVFRIAPAWAAEFIRRIACLFDKREGPAWNVVSITRMTVAELLPILDEVIEQYGTETSR